MKKGAARWWVFVLFIGMCHVAVRAELTDEGTSGQLGEQNSAVVSSATIMVTDDTLRAIHGARVTLTGPVSSTAVSGIDGVVVFEGLPTGTYWAVVTHPLFAFNAASFTVVADDILRMEVAGRPVVSTASIAGRVLDEAGQGVMDVLVTLNGPVQAAVRTTCDGSFGFDGLAAGAYLMRFSREGYAFTPAEKRFPKLDSNRTDERIRARTLLRIPADEVNLLETTKRMRARGWGEYRAAGRCLCCDNIRDGDCIIIGNVERTEKLLIPQVIDGIRTPTLDDPSGYFGDVAQRGSRKLVSELYVQIDLPSPRMVTRLVVWTVKRDGKPLLTNAEVGYLDQFDRIQWAVHRDGNRDREFIELPLPRRVYTRSIVVRVEGGASRISEIEVYGVLER